MAGTIFANPLECAVVCAVLMVAQAVYVLFGFGAGLIAVGSLALVITDIQDVVVVLLLVSLPAELMVVVGSWRRVRWRTIGGLAVAFSRAAGKGPRQDGSYYYEGRNGNYYPSPEWQLS